ncbi:MAG: hypothetical protein SGARI_005105, partial [Bacillariaceae sp.]
MSVRNSPSRRSFRVELFFKDIPDLKQRVQFLNQHGVDRFNLVNKSKKDEMDAWVDAIRNVSPEAHISSHYSIKYNKIPRKGPQEQQENFLKALSQSQADEILIINGSGDKMAWNTVSALEAVSKASVESPLLAVAYNPYFPNQDEQDKENQRLKDKLATRCVGKVYLQFGSDLGRLKTGLEYLDGLNLQ